MLLTVQDPFSLKAPVSFCLGKLKCSREGERKYGNLKSPVLIHPTQRLGGVGVKLTKAHIQRTPVGFYFALRLFFSLSISHSPLPYLLSSDKTLRLSSLINLMPPCPLKYGTTFNFMLYLYGVDDCRTDVFILIHWARAAGNHNAICRTPRHILLLNSIIGMKIILLS